MRQNCPHVLCVYVCAGHSNVKTQNGHENIIGITFKTSHITLQIFCRGDASLLPTYMPICLMIDK